MHNPVMSQLAIQTELDRSRPIAFRQEIRQSVSMASIRKRGKSWHVEIVKIGHPREYASFPTKAEAASWVLQREAEIVGAKLPERTLKDALIRYGREVAPTHRGERWELLRCDSLARLPWAKKQVSAITAADIAAWRDSRLRPVGDGKAVQPGTVRREMTMLRSVFDVALKEWGWIRVNPMDAVKKPPAPPSRKRRISADEIERVTLALGYTGGIPENQSQRVALAYLFALETAMRSGEILGLTWDKIGAKSVELPFTKNGDARSVPLSSRAREIIGLMPRDAATVFNLDPALRDALFRKARDRAGIENLTFHDSRAEAIWRLSKKLDVMELARVIGHRDLRSLLIYYQTTADELADRLG